MHCFCFSFHFNALPLQTFSYCGMLVATPPLISVLIVSCICYNQVRLSLHIAISGYYLIETGQIIIMYRVVR